MPAWDGGWRLLPRYRTYGAALVGCGAGICYLAVWAASSLYGFLPPATGIAGLALVSLSLAAIAWAVDVEALAATATAGLLMAPVLLGQDQENSNVLVLYLSVAALTLGMVCSLRRWRLTTFLLAAGTIWLGFVAEPGANPLGTLGLAALVGTGGLAIGLREHWWETRLASFSGGWALVTAAAHRLDPGQRWPVLAAALALALPVWLLELRAPRDGSGHRGGAEPLGRRRTALFPAHAVPAGFCARLGCSLLVRGARRGRGRPRCAPLCRSGVDHSARALHRGWRGHARARRRRSLERRPGGGRAAG